MGFRRWLFAPVLLEIANLKGLVMSLNASLSAAIASLTASVAAETSELDSIETFVKGIPDLVAKAVADALAENSIDETEAAASIEAARAAVAGKVDEVLAAVTANTPSAPAPADAPTTDTGATS